jgi:hypothetical protein
MATTTDEIDFDISQLDDTLISDNQKQTLIDYINQLKNQKHSINDEFNQFKLSTGSINIKTFIIFFILQLLLFLFLTKRTNECSFFLVFLLFVFFSISYKSSYSPKKPIFNMKKYVSIRFCMLLMLNLIF